ncbi:hypothetical protein [Acinetobacter sp. YH16044]|uniref:hypothetical protein n=1 Tax=Acinetobacter sp. YH16044 TaxID=2601187 RepID=UPI0015D14DB2|nr:hypothetical protein [Acinetobacter sp. YH16044]
MPVSIAVGKAAGYAQSADIFAEAQLSWEGLWRWVELWEVPYKRRMSCPSA